MIPCSDNPHIPRCTHACMHTHIHAHACAHTLSLSQYCNTKLLVSFVWKQSKRSGEQPIAFFSNLLPIGLAFLHQGCFCLAFSNMYMATEIRNYESQKLHDYSICTATETGGIDNGLDPWVLESKHLSGQQVLSLKWCMIYRIAQNIGRRKLWRIWQLIAIRQCFLSPGFCTSCT